MYLSPPKFSNLFASFNKKKVSSKRFAPDCMCGRRTYVKNLRLDNFVEMLEWVSSAAAHCKNSRILLLFIFYVKLILDNPYLDS